MHALCGGEIKREKGIPDVDFPAVKSVIWSQNQPGNPTASGGELIFLDFLSGWFPALGLDFLKRDA
jgi:hypothetical protein